MPVLKDIPVDPTDIYMQGEQLRSVALLSSVSVGPGPYLGIVNYQRVDSRYPIVQNDGSGLSIQGADLTQLVDHGLRPNISYSSIRANAVIAAPTGALIPIPFGRTMMGGIGVEVETATDLFSITGVTKNSAGSPLGDCRVVALETGRIHIGGTPVVGETISDGSGNYSITVPTNGSFQLIAYKPGSPDVAGITRSDVVPAQV